MDININQPTGRFFSPFSLKHDPMQRLLLINFERDPDEYYTAFEPQIFNDPINGKGLMVIAYHKGGTFDIYHQPGVTLKHKNYAIVGKGLVDLIERPLEGARFEVAPRGLDLRFAFEDKHGRSVSVRILENSRKPTQPFSLLAPFPNAAEKPPSLPLALLYDFYFVRRSGTDIEILIDGRTHAPDQLPAPIDGSWMYFVRYSTDPFILNWNEAYEGPLTPLLPYSAVVVEDQEIIYDLVKQGDYLDIGRIRPKHAEHDVSITFEPPFPDITGLREGFQTNGKFTIWMEESLGRIEGVYALQRVGDRVEIEVHPSGGWLPGVRKWSVRIMFRLVPLFTRWPKTYRWNASIDLSQGEVPVMKSGWSRIKTA